MDPQKIAQVVVEHIGRDQPVTELIGDPTDEEDLRAADRPIDA
jgi:(2Fe-2S) ferredoxin